MLTYTYISKGKFGLVEKSKPTIQHERDVIMVAQMLCLKSPEPAPTKSVV